MITTRRFSLTIGGAVFDSWTRCEVVRDLSEISGSFALELVDPARSAATWVYATLRDLGPMVHGLEARVAIDGEPVLVGWIDEVVPQASEGFVSVTVIGRDQTGDLVDCAATVEGPSEFKGLDLLQITQAIVAPFGLTARADVDVGEPFDRYTIDPGETAMSAIEKGARRRALLVTSDGVGAVVLTRSGQRRAPGAIVFPGSAFESAGSVSARDRFSDYHVLGQAEGGGGIRATSAPLDGSAEPLGSLPDALPATREDAGVAIHGHAVDPEIKRWRPLVSLARTQTTAADATTQADWMMRTARAQSEKLDYAVKGYRGPSGALWRPNELAFVEDSFQIFARDMLIAGVVYGYGDDGETTRLRMTGPEAYDLLPEEERRNKSSAGRKGGKSSKSGKSTGALDGTAEAL